MASFWDRALTAVISGLASGAQPLLAQIFRSIGGDITCGSEAQLSTNSGEEETGSLPKPGSDAAQLGGLCASSRQQFCTFAQAVSGDVSNPHSVVYHSYVSALDSLNDELRNIVDSSATRDQALRLVKETMNASGALKDVSRAREALFSALSDESAWPALSVERLALLRRQLDSLDAWLKRLEGEIWFVLVSLASGAIEDLWAKDIYDVWTSKISYRSREDPTQACERISEFIAMDLERFVADSLEYFYEGNNQRRCRLKRYNGAEMPLVREACELLRAVRDEQFQCQSSGDVAPVEVAGLDVQASSTLLELTISTGDSSWTYSNSAGTATRKAGAGSAPVSLTLVYNLEGRPTPFVVPRLAPDLRVLVGQIDKVREGRVGAGYVEFGLRRSELPSTMRVSPRITLLFSSRDVIREASGGATPGRLAAIRLPRQLVAR